MERTYRFLFIMKIFHFHTGPFSVNTYFLVNEERGEGVVVDPGGNQKRLELEAQRAGVRLVAQLLTHGHFDHAGACAGLSRAGLPLYVHAADADKLTGSGNLAALMGFLFEPVRPDFLLEEGEIELAGLPLRILHTPGHTEGGVCFLSGDALLTGDTLFRRSVGRTDFPGGDPAALQRSVQKLFALPGDFRVFPGHEDFTTLEEERRENPFAEFSSKKAGR